MPLGSAISSIVVAPPYAFASCTDRPSGSGATSSSFSFAPEPLPLSHPLPLPAPCPAPLWPCFPSPPFCGFAAFALVAAFAAALALPCALACVDAFSSFAASSASLAASASCAFFPARREDRFPLPTSSAAVALSFSALSTAAASAATRVDGVAVVASCPSGDGPRRPCAVSVDAPLLFE